jgi:hypothetical protein
MTHNFMGESGRIEAAKPSNPNVSAIAARANEALLTVHGLSLAKTSAYKFCESNMPY